MYEYLRDIWTLIGENLLVLIVKWIMLVGLFESDDGIIEIPVNLFEKYFPWTGGVMCLFHCKNN